jgi:hypothetical protein
MKERVIIMTLLAMGTIASQAQTTFTNAGGNVRTVANWTEGLSTGGISATTSVD